MLKFRTAISEELNPSEDWGVTCAVSAGTTSGAEATDSAVLNSRAEEFELVEDFSCTFWRVGVTSVSEEDTPPGCAVTLGSTIEPSVEDSFVAVKTREVFRALAFPAAPTLSVSMDTLVGCPPGDTVAGDMWISSIIARVRLSSIVVRVRGPSVVAVAPSCPLVSGRSSNATHTATDNMSGVRSEEQHRSINTNPRFFSFKMKVSKSLPFSVKRHTKQNKRDLETTPCLPVSNIDLRQSMKTTWN